MAVEGQPIEFIGCIIAQVTLPIGWACPGPVRACTSTVLQTLGLLATRRCLSAPLATVTYGQARVTCNLHVTLASLAKGSRVQRITLTVAHLGFNLTPILTLNDALVTVCAIPEPVTLAGARGLVEDSMYTFDNALIAQFPSPSFITHASAIFPAKSTHEEVNSCKA